MNLGWMPKPVNDATSCGLDQLPEGPDDTARADDLFKRKRMKGWWPAFEVNEDGEKELNVRERLVTCSV